MRFSEATFECPYCGKRVKIVSDHLELEHSNDPRRIENLKKLDNENIRAEHQGQ